MSPQVPVSVVAAVAPAVLPLTQHSTNDWLDADRMLRWRRIAQYGITADPAGKQPWFMGGAIGMIPQAEGASGYGGNSMIGLVSATLELGAPSLKS